MSDDDSSNEDDDESLFRRLAAGITPLPPHDKVPAPEAKPVPRARFSRADDANVIRESLEVDVDEMETSSGEHLRFNRPAVGRRTMRRLARGNFSIQNEIDLHGMTIPEAREALQVFLQDSCDLGHGCVRIVHGKGLGSGPRGPVLKNKVNAWLRRREEVLAFSSARQVDGGTGALYVLLRRR